MYICSVFCFIHMKTFYNMKRGCKHRATMYALLLWVLTAIVARAQQRACPIIVPAAPTTLYAIERTPATVRNLPCQQHGTPWQHPERVRREDGSYATLLMPQMGWTQCLYASDFRFDLPPHAIVTGVELIVKGHVKGTAVRDLRIQLVDTSGMPYGVNLQSTAQQHAWQSRSDTIWTYGGKNTTWQTTLSPDVINHPQWGVLIQLLHPGMDSTAEVYVDVLRLRVYFRLYPELCRDLPAEFIVRPLAHARRYHWQIPPGAEMLTMDDSSNAIALNIRPLANGLHRICVRTETNLGLSDPCCTYFFKSTPCRGAQWSGTVWLDADGDGLRQAAEQRLAGIEVELYKIVRGRARLIAQTHTDTAGTYRFDGLASGLYYVWWKVPTDLQPTSPHRGAPNRDSDLTEANGPGTSSTRWVSAAHPAQRIDAGLLSSCMVMASKPHLQALEGGCDTHRPWEVVLRDAPTTHIPPGYRRYTLIADTRDSIVAVVADLQFVWTLPGQYRLYTAVVDGDSSSPDYVDPSLWGTQWKTIDAWRSYLQSKGLCAALSDDALVLDIKHCGAIEGIVWRDANANGLREPSEEPLTDIEVFLHDVTTGRLWTTKTNGQGSYRWHYLHDGPYVVEIQPPADLRLTVKDAGADDIDSDFNYDGRSDTILVQMDTHHIDAGLRSMCLVEAPPLMVVQMGSPCFDGTPYNVELAPIFMPPLPAGYVVEYIVIDRLTGVMLYRSTVPRFTLRSDGAYDVRAVVYHPQVGNRGYIDWSRFTLGSSTIDQLLQYIEDGDICAAVSDQAAQLDVPRCPFIAGRVWWDANSNGIQEQGERGIANYDLWILNDQGDTVAHLKTLANGTYTHTLLREGQYRIAVRALEGHRFSPKDVGLDFSDSDVDSTGHSDLYLLQYGDRLILDAGIYADCPFPEDLTHFTLQLDTPGCIRANRGVRLWTSGQFSPPYTNLSYRFILTTSQNPWRYIAIQPTDTFVVDSPGAYIVWVLRWFDTSVHLLAFDGDSLVRSHRSVASLINALQSLDACLQLDSSDHAVEIERCTNSFKDVLTPSDALPYRTFTSFGGGAPRGDGRNDLLHSSHNAESTTHDDAAPWMDVFPNPVGGTLYLRARVARGVPVQVQLLDPTRRPHLRIVLPPAREGRVELRLSVEELPPGTYLLVLTDGRHQLQRTFVKLP